MSNEPKIITPTVSQTEVFIDGKSYTLKQLRRYIEFYNDHQITIGQEACPLCGSYYDENGLFICEECGALLSIEEDKCIKHEHDNIVVCKNCCDVCQREKARIDDENLRIDQMRGK